MISGIKVSSDRIDPHRNRCTVAHRTSKPRVLVTEDDGTMLDLLCDVLRSADFEVITADGGEAALDAIASECVDLLVLDLGIPGKDGLQVLEELRRSSRIPVIVVSGRMHTHVKVACLGLGADDYMTKPFACDELVARCRSALRRASALPSVSSLDVGGVRIDFGKRKVTVEDREIRLTNHEYELLKELLLNAGTTQTYTQLLQRVWGLRNEEPREYVHIYVNRLRSKIETDPKKPQRLVAISGIGYMFRV